MKKIVFFALLAVLVFNSCKKDPTPTPAEEPKAAIQKTELITVNGLSREYIIYLPTGYNLAASLPLVFCLHGGGGTDSSFISLASFNPMAEREKFIVVYPQGIQKSWNDGRPTTANLQGVDDVNFFRSMIQQFSAAYKIDAKRIYITGISNGGFMSSRLGAELGDKIAAFASDAASVEKLNVYPGITGTNPVSAMYIQGTADPLVSFTGGVMAAGSGGTIASHAEAVTKWITANNCNTTAVVTSIPDIANDGTTAVRRDYNGGTKGTAVTSIIIQNGGHTWPQGTQYLSELVIGKTCQDFNGVETVWEFFKTHPKQ